MCCTVAASSALQVSKAATSLEGLSLRLVKLKPVSKGAREFLRRTFTFAVEAGRDMAPSGRWEEDGGDATVPNPTAGLTSLMLGDIHGDAWGVTPALGALTPPFERSSDAFGAATDSATVRTSLCK